MTSTADTPRRSGMRRLEKRLSAVRELEQKRARQLDRAQRRDTGGKTATKRLRQLAKVRRRSAALLAKVDLLRPGPTAYCLRERTTVVMRQPQPMTMRNGRAGTAGVCPSCGARVVRPA